MNEFENVREFDEMRKSPTDRAKGVSQNVWMGEWERLSGSVSESDTEKRMNEWQMTGWNQYFRIHTNLHTFRFMLLREAHLQTTNKHFYKFPYLSNKQVFTPKLGIDNLIQTVIIFVAVNWQYMISLFSRLHE